MSGASVFQGSSTGQAERASNASLPLGTIGYLVVSAALVVGWLMKDQHVLAAEYGLGYLLGIVGSSLMVLLLLYPLRKRVRVLARVGRVKDWFRAHMVLGVLGPTLILFHCNFSLGSFNSRIALFCTLVVAVSGLVGRYIYARIHHGLYGRRASVAELRGAFSSLDEQFGSIRRIAPELIETLTRAEDHVQRGHTGVLGSIARAVRAAVITRVVGFRLRREIRSTLQDLAERSPVYAAERDRLERNWLALLQRRLMALRTLAQFACYERAFALWHVVHYPLFLVMVVAVILHVVAVHMY